MKGNFTHKDHFKCGWGQGTFNFDDKQDLPYWVQFGRCERKPLVFREECVNSAQLIGKLAEKPILLFLSGGVDSEIMARSFIEASIPFEAVIVRMFYNKQSCNEYDIVFALDFVKKYNIKYHIFEYNVNDFVREKYIPYAEKYQTWMPGSLIHVDYVREYCKDFLCVFGLGDIILYRPQLYGYPETEDMLYLQEPQSVTTIHSAIEEGETVVAKFLSYTPEMILSWLLSEDVRTFVKYEKAFPKLSIYEFKPFLYFKYWPEMAPRPKYHGFEQINVFDKNRWNESNPAEVEIVKKVRSMDFSKMKVYLRYSDLIKMLSPE